ncbi:MAG: hypothetical protein AB1918_00330 [Pseudomonadota bacterium]
MKIAFSVLAACLTLAACGADHPAPGQPPGWEMPPPPRSSDSLPVPLRDQYIKPTNVKQLPPVPEGENVPYAVRGQTQHLPKLGEDKPAEADGGR